MTTERRLVILADIASAREVGFLTAFVWGLRQNGEMSDPDVALAIRAKLKAEGWKYEEWKP